MNEARCHNEGFTLVEILVAIVILSVGLLALAQASGTVTTMIGRGKQDTKAALVAQARFETLRQVAATTTPKCTALANGTRTIAQDGTTEAWTISGSGTTRTVQVSVTYRVSRGTRTVVSTSQLECF